MMNLPSRHRPTASVVERFGPRVQRLGSMLLVGDPMADAAVESMASLSRDARDALVDRALREGSGAVREPVPEPLRALLDEVEQVPFWFDRARAERGGRAFLRSGLLGGIVLGLKSLVGGYCSPAGNKPLVFSGRLREDVPRRLLETSKYVRAVTLPSGMALHSDGYVASVKVRLMHASVRRMLQRSNRWDLDAWGVPINQFDMAGTVFLFSTAVTDGLDDLGFHLTRSEREDFLHLWRYAGHLMGVRDELLCASTREAADLAEMIKDTQALPDADSRDLAAALIETPLVTARTPTERFRAEGQAQVAYALSRYLVGDRYADALGFPKTVWRYGLPFMKVVFSQMDTVRRGVPGLERLALSVGLRHWEAVTRTPVDRPVTFAMPERVKSA